jgi:hypothetical protein
MQATQSGTVHSEEIFTSSCQVWITLKRHFVSSECKGCLFWSCASPPTMEKVAIGMLGYYSYLECQVFHLLKETGFLPKQVDMLPGYTRISRGVIEKSCNCALGCLVIILI